MEPTLYIGITQSLFAGLILITKKPAVLSNRLLAIWLFMIVLDMLLALLVCKVDSIFLITTVLFAYGPLFIAAINCELENIIERAVILSKSSTLSVEALQKRDPIDEDKFNSLADYERKYVEKVLKATFWRIEGPKGAARILDINPKTLRSRMQKLGIVRP